MRYANSIKYIYVYVYIYIHNTYIYSEREKGNKGRDTGTENGRRRASKRSKKGEREEGYQPEKTYLEPSVTHRVTRDD